jgi:hypothetical protein
MLYFQDKKKCSLWLFRARVDSFEVKMEVVLKRERLEKRTLSVLSYKGRTVAPKNERSRLRRTKSISVQ